MITRSCDRTEAHVEHEFDFKEEGVDSIRAYCPGRYAAADPRRSELVPPPPDAAHDYGWRGSELPDETTPEGELRAWWRDISKIDEDAVVPKAIEYSAVDLEIIGRGLMAFNPGLWAAAPEEDRSEIAAEMATTFYTLGKVARAIGAFSEGRRPSDDTWHDVTVYSMMARRIRSAGRWGL